ncbi:hypothetical protein SNEBB_010940 [Seison nebaliae]|nr:hypothetical protein SNEBB_010940 [Seison nebaliae]
MSYDDNESTTISNANSFDFDNLSSYEYFESEKLTEITPIESNFESNGKVTQSDTDDISVNTLSTDISITSNIDGFFKQIHLMMTSFVNNFLDQTAYLNKEERSLVVGAALPMNYNQLSDETKSRFIDIRLIATVNCFIEHIIRRKWPPRLLWLYFNECNVENATLAQLINEAEITSYELGKILHWQTIIYDKYIVQNFKAYIEEFRSYLNLEYNCIQKNLRFDCHQKGLDFFQEPLNENQNQMNDGITNKNNNMNELDESITDNTNQNNTTINRNRIRYKVNKTKCGCVQGVFPSGYNCCVTITTISKQPRTSDDDKMNKKMYFDEFLKSKKVDLQYSMKLKDKKLFAEFLKTKKPEAQKIGTQKVVTESTEEDGPIRFDINEPLTFQQLKRLNEHVPEWGKNKPLFKLFEDRGNLLNIGDNDLAKLFSEEIITIISQKFFELYYDVEQFKDLETVKYQKARLNVQQFIEDNLDRYQEQSAEWKLADAFEPIPVNFEKTLKNQTNSESVDKKYGKLERYVERLYANRDNKDIFDQTLLALKREGVINSSVGKSLQNHMRHHNRYTLRRALTGWEITPEIKNGIWKRDLPDETIKNYLYLNKLTRTEIEKLISGRMDWDFFSNLVDMRDPLALNKEKMVKSGNEDGILYERTASIQSIETFDELIDSIEEFGMFQKKFKKFFPFSKYEKQAFDEKQITRELFEITKNQYYDKETLTDFYEKLGVTNQPDLESLLKGEMEYGKFATLFPNLKVEDGDVIMKQKTKDQGTSSLIEGQAKKEEEEEAKVEEKRKEVEAEKIQTALTKRKKDMVNKLLKEIGEDYVEEDEEYSLSEIFTEEEKSDFAQLLRSEELSKVVKEDNHLKKMFRRISARSSQHFAADLVERAKSLDSEGFQNLFATSLNKSPSSITPTRKQAVKSIHSLILRDELSEAAEKLSKLISPTDEEINETANEIHNIVLNSFQKEGLDEGLEELKKNKDEYKKKIKTILRRHSIPEQVALDTVIEYWEETFGKKNKKSKKQLLSELLEDDDFRTNIEQKLMDMVPEILDEQNLDPDGTNVANIKKRLMKKIKSEIEEISTSKMQSKSSSGVDKKKRSKKRTIAPSHKKTDSEGTRESEDDWVNTHLNKALNEEPVPSKYKSVDGNKVVKPITPPNVQQIEITLADVPILEKSELEIDLGFIPIEIAQTIYSRVPMLEVRTTSSLFRIDGITCENRIIYEDCVQYNTLIATEQHQTPIKYLLNEVYYGRPHVKRIVTLPLRPNALELDILINGSPTQIVKVLKRKEVDPDIIEVLMESTIEEYDFILKRLFFPSMVLPNLEPTAYAFDMAFFEKKFGVHGCTFSLEGKFEKDARDSDDTYIKTGITRETVNTLLNEPDKSKRKKLLSKFLHFSELSEVKVDQTCILLENIMDFAKRWCMNCDKILVLLKMMYTIHLTNIKNGSNNIDDLNEVVRDYVFQYCVDKPGHSRMLFNRLELESILTKINRTYFLFQRLYKHLFCATYVLDLWLWNEKQNFFGEIPIDDRESSVDMLNLQQMHERLPVREGESTLREQRRLYRQMKNHIRRRFATILWEKEKEIREPANWDDFKNII